MTKPNAANLYRSMGVRSVINGRGATTAVGGTIMPPAVLAAMAEAASSFVVLEELAAVVGTRIAAITGAEAGCVVNGSAAGMALAAAACIAGADLARSRRLPDSDGLPNEIIIHRCQRINYDNMFRLGGGRLVEIGWPLTTEPWELMAALSARTAAVAWIDSPMTTPGHLPFDLVREAASAHGVPVIVDAASTLPPVSHLRRWIDRGADLVIYSGGKGIRGPQDSGLLAGRRDLIEAARLSSNPNAGIGRGMKVSKEAMAGLWVALDLFVQTDHQKEYDVHLAQAKQLVDAFSALPGLLVTLEDDWEIWPAPVVRLHLAVGAQWTPSGLVRELAAGEPSIQLSVDRQGVLISTHCLAAGEEAIIVDRMSTILAGHPVGGGALGGP